MEPVISSLIACFVVLGLPLLILFIVLKLQDRKYCQRQKQQSDEEYLAAHGPDAYKEMLSKRALSPPISALVGSPNEGIWYSRCTPDKLIMIIEINHSEALIGNPPYRLSELSSDMQAQEMHFSASWPNPKSPQVSSFLDLHLRLTLQANGRTAIVFKYISNPEDDPFAKQIITLTSHWLKRLCEGAQ